MMKVSVRIGFVLLFFGVTAFGLCYAKDPIHIGLSAPMTGPYAANGDSFKKAIELAIDQINNAGGINGQSIELVIEDTRGVPKGAKRVARKFVRNKQIVATIGSLTSTNSMASRSVYQRSGLVQLSPTASHPSFAGGSPFSFATNGIQSGTSQFMAQTVVKKLGRKKLAVIYLNNEWGIISQKFFTDEAEKLGAEIVATEAYLDGTTDFNNILRKCKTSAPELLFLFSMYNEGVMINQQRQELGWGNVTVAGDVSFHSPEFIKKGKDAVENVYVFTSFFSESPAPDIQKFVTAYTTRYAHKPGIYAALAYDSLNILAAAIRQGGTERKTIRDALAATKDFPGITGNITFDNYGCTLKIPELLQVRKGKFVLCSKE